jgi:acyl-CoA dehydrogenase
VGGLDATVEPLLEHRHAVLYEASRSLHKVLEPLERRAEQDVRGAAKSALRALAQAELLRQVVPKANGGALERPEVRALVAIRDGVAQAGGLADAMFALQGLGSLPLTLAGSDEQRKAWLPRVAKGTAIAGFAMTEPDAGSDAAAITTRATRTLQGWELSGTKTFISNAGLADFYTLFAKTDPGAGGKGITAFLVPGDARGLSVEPLQTLAPHPLGTLRLQKVQLGRDAMVGVEKEGLKLALRTLDVMRPTVAAAACGLAARGLEEALKRARARRQFGRPIAEYQGLRWRLADAATELQAARLLVHRAAWLKDLGQERITLESAQAKLFATEAAQRIVDLALQVHGGTGVLAGTIVERLYREVRALRIYEGTSEILRDVVARGVLEDGAR